MFSALRGKPARSRTVSKPSLRPTAERWRGLTSSRFVAKALRVDSETGSHSSDLNSAACGQAAPPGTQSLRRIAASVAIVFAAACSIGATRDDAIQHLRADHVEVRLRVEPLKATAADTITAELEVLAPTSVAVEISDAPAAPRPAGQLKLVSDSSVGPVALRAGLMQYRRVVVYRPFLAGKYEVPPFAVAYRSPSVAAKLATKSVPIEVASVVSGDPALAKPAGLLAIDSPRRGAGWRIGTCAAGLAVTVIFAVWWIRYRRQRAVLNTAAAPDPFTGALTSIESLPATDVVGLERAIESLRAQGLDPLSGVLGETYQWIRFGSPSSRDIESFTTSVKEHLRENRRAAGRKAE